MTNINKIKSGNFQLLVIQIIAVCTVVLLLPSCRKFVEVKNSRTELLRSTVFENDALAKAAVLGIYTVMSSNGYSSGGIDGISFTAAVSADEMIAANPDNEFYVNNILPTNNVLPSFWSQPYNHIYRANHIIESLSVSNGITQATKKQILGEAKFIRAFSYFYLVNLFGDVPLVLTTDYRVNAVIGRTPRDKVYVQILSDLKEAENLLSSNYLFSNGERVRPTNWAAKALLARAYLYLKDYVNAELKASEIIENTLLYDTVPINGVFLKNSKEAIWQLSRDNGNTRDAGTFKFTSIPTNGSLRETIVHSFELNDKRRINWIGQVTTGGITYYYPDKYKVVALAPITEYSMVLRLGEQYLIRAEARLKQEKITGQNSAQSDLDLIRKRAGLPGITATSFSDMLFAIERERLHELFSEWGHRWLDLKRWPSLIYPADTVVSRADDVLQPLKSFWSKEDKLYPIPQDQINNDPAMAQQQNPGYY